MDTNTSLACFFDNVFQAIKHPELSQRAAEHADKQAWVADLKALDRMLIANRSAAAAASEQAPSARAMQLFV